MLTHAANQRCIKLSKVAPSIVVTTHLEQRDDNITQANHTMTESTRKSTINKGTDTNQAIEGRHEVIAANRKETIIMNSTKYDSPSQPTRGIVSDYHDTVQVTFHFYRSFLCHSLVEMDIFCLHFVHLQFTFRSYSS